MKSEKNITKTKAAYGENLHLRFWMALIMLLLLGTFFFQQHTSEQKMKRYLQSFIGNACESNAEWGQELLRIMFETEVSAPNLEAGQRAFVEYGYTQEGIEFLMDAQRQMRDYLPLGIFVVLLAVFLLVLWMYEAKLQKIIRQLMETIGKQERKIKEMHYVDVQNKHLQSFIENIAHQIKTPLSRVVTSLDLVSEELNEKNAEDKDDVDEFRLQAVKRIEETFTHLNVIRQLITKLIHIGRMEAGTVLFSKEKLLLEELLYDSWYACVGQSKITEVPVDVQVFPESAEYYVIQIRDHGPGFFVEDIPNLFSRFYTPKNEKQGHVGIGLNLARLIVEGHNGTICARNHEEGGAVFELLLPVYQLKEMKKL